MMVVAGMTAEEIANEYGLTKRTIQDDIRNIRSMHKNKGLEKETADALFDMATVMDWVRSEAIDIHMNIRGEKPKIALSALTLIHKTTSDKLKALQSLGIVYTEPIKVDSVESDAEKRAREAMVLHKKAERDREAEFREVQDDEEQNP